ncbi:ArsR/SmtB family transcription factor [Halorhabdus amylolytica]|uniref:ArsR/SmtB family transcription factor n=1 Tax=Halorhabdus amylolytica TaxID=2559573 RepID=UPI0010AAD1E1|nr:metalloregulator ArsR/SmtB family transcription factor [Halorhabdus amylolytica]
MDRGATAETGEEGRDSAACCTAVEHGLSADEVAADLELLDAVGSGTRYEALQCIAAGGEVCVCEIEAALDVSQGAISQALARLTDVGLLDRRKEGRWRYYASTDRADRLLETIEEVRSVDE